MADIQQASGETLAPVAFCTAAARKWVLLVAILASSLGFIDSSVTSIAIPAIRASLGATLAQAQWIGASYLLVLAALVLAGGAMGDRFGAARVFGAGIMVFSLGSLLCAVAPTANTLIAARVVQGVGAALMIPGSMAMIGRAYPREARGRALGIWAAASAITTALGPVLGGALLTAAPEWGWRIIFGVNLPLGLAVLAVLRAKVTGDAGQPGAPVDFIGAGLATAGLGLLSFVLTEPGRHGATITVAGIACMAAFLWWELRARHPMLRLGLFRDPRFAAVNIATLLLYFALTGVSFYLPMTAIAAWGARPVDITAAFVPFSILIGGLSSPMGRLADIKGPMPLIATGSVVVAIAFGLLAFATDFWWHTVPCMVLAGFGMALVVAPLSAAVMACVDDMEQGAASGINNAVSRAAGLVAVALMGRVAAWGYARAGGEASFADMDVAGATQAAATTEGFAWVAWVSAICAGLAAVVIVAGFRRGLTSQNT
jgi:EmrB/QacA subfamily drug resistance transporter